MIVLFLQSIWSLSSNRSHGVQYSCQYLPVRLWGWFWVHIWRKKNKLTNLLYLHPSCLHLPAHNIKTQNPAPLQLTRKLFSKALQFLENEKGLLEILQKHLQFPLQILYVFHRLLKNLKRQSIDRMNESAPSMESLRGLMKQAKDLPWFSLLV